MYKVVMPIGEEPSARHFWADKVGLDEVEKPVHLRPRGGCWFHTEPVWIHVGVDPNFTPATKAHPAIVVSDLDALKVQLVEGGYSVNLGTQILGFRRFYTEDPFSNRVQFLETLR